MKFTEHRDSNVYMIKHYEPGCVKINQQVLRESCFLSQTKLVENWDCESFERLNSDALTPMLALKPEVILLGTGETQRFPHPELFQYCAQHGIGLEVMNNLAACRTFNVLATEDRNVVLALILT
jgi:uncharacterized protein